MSLENAASSYQVDVLTSAATKVALYHKHIFHGFSRAINRPAGRVKRFPNSHGSNQAISRVESGRVQEAFKSHGSAAKIASGHASRARRFLISRGSNLAASRVESG